MRGLYTVLALVFVALATRFGFPGFPDVAVALFSALSLASPYVFCLVLGICLGIITEGLAPGSVWITPLLYVLLASASRYARTEMRLSRWMLIGYFVFWGAVFEILPPVAHGYGLDPVDATLGSVLTGLLAYLAYLPWTRG